MMRTITSGINRSVQLSWLPWLAWLGLNGVQSRLRQRGDEREGRERTVQEPPGARQLHLAALAGAAALMVPAIPAGPLDRRFLPAKVPLSALGLTTEVLGLALSLWARAELGRHWTGRVTFTDDQPLIQDGPYRYVRHPLYAGLLLGAIGTAITLGRLRGLAAVLLLIAAYRRKTAYEEAALREHFGEAYEEYMSAVAGYLPRFGNR